MKIEQVHNSLIIITIILASTFSALAQPAVADFKTVFQLRIKETKTPIKIDGILDDPSWKTANIGGSFWQKTPFFAEGADPKTEVKLTYDSDNLYVAAKCYQKDKIIVQSLKRDEYWDNDGIAIILDPLNTRTNAFLFGVTAAGAQWDGLGASGDVNSDWSNKWYSEVNVNEGYWTMEMAIPLRILRFSPDSDTWGMNFVRNHMNENEYHNWTAVPESFWPPDPAFAGSLIFETPPMPQKGNYNIIPFVTSSINKIKSKKTKLDADIGLDARISLTPTLNVDLTFNPDFSQIEVDELVTNLTRFSIFLPEKRTFFLENSDLFSDVGYPDVRPFFSRTIGLDSKRQAVPILYGARLTGNLTKTLRLGIMNIHSLSSDNSNAQNQSALSMQKQFGRSYIKGMFLNRQGFDDFSSVAGDYGRNSSLEAAYVRDDGQLSAWFGIHHSYKPEASENTGFYTAGIEFNNPKWEGILVSAITQENYFADMGFIARIENYDAQNDTVVRIGFNDNIANLTYRIRPKEGIVTRHNISVKNQVIFNPDWTLNERINGLNYSVAFRSTAEFEIGYTSTGVDLLFPFSFVSGGLALPSERYDYSFISAGFGSDERKLISYGIDGRIGGFYNGTLNQAKADINFRVQPWGNLGFGYQWNKLDFPDEYGEETITALLSKLEIGFNKNLLWTTLFQFLDQSEYMGINSRLQWRFAPMSDVFIVFVDNYDVFNGIGGPKNIQSNNRALIFKMNYWY
ncbi:MAG: hypothetical protein ACI9P5_002538 [Saprospiraceae bacterium]|jgi:hypothetical protein